MAKTFDVYNLGCRVNAAETNLFSQTLIDDGFTKDNTSPDIIFVNTCSVTAKANVESLGLIRRLRKQYPLAQIIISGCADTKNIASLKNVLFLSNQDKEIKLNLLKSLYNPKIGDKFSHTHRFLLKVQSGCTANCTYCTVPLTRPYLWSIPINNAVDTTNSAISNGYQEIIITGVNLNQYTPGLSNLLEALLTQTSAPLISFGSLPLLCIDEKFLKLYQKYPSRLSHFLHIPLQSGSDKVLKLMHRPHTREKIINTFDKLKNIDSKLEFGTDIIVAFPGETDTDFQDTLSLCQQIGFKKIHTFRFSPRTNTAAAKFSNSTTPATAIKRSQRLRKLLSPVSQSA